MSFSTLYKFIEKQDSVPSIIEGVVDKKILELSTQDEIWYTPVDLNTKISLGHIKQCRIQKKPYDQNPLWVTFIRYHKDLNLCWKRFVCCKELMHVFDSKKERVDSAIKFDTLLKELSSHPLTKEASEPFKSENKTKWMALAILCPLSVRELYKKKIQSGEMSNYDVALDLRMPELLVPIVMDNRFVHVVKLLTNHD